MKNIFYILFTALFLLGGQACKKDLDVQNPNQPTLEEAKTESGIISLSSGAVYTNGFNTVDVAGLNWLGDSYFSLAIGFHELLGDMVTAEAANQNINVVNLPDYVILDDNTKITNTSPSKSVLRISNTRDKRAANAFYYEWTYLYAMNNSINNVLDLVEEVAFTGNAEARKNTVKAWAYWWKGFVYSRIGSIYYAGVINNTAQAKIPEYVTHEAIIAEANKNFDAASAILNAMSSIDDYNAVLGQLLPGFLQTGKGGVLTPQMWIRNINTMKARNLLVNKRVSEMTTADWTEVLALADNGIQRTDFVFTGRTTGLNGFFSAGTGSVAAMTTGDPNASTYKISERLIQEYKPGDKRFLNNYEEKEYLNQVGGFTSSTRYALVDGGNGLPGVQVLTNQVPGEYELYIASTYEENELMKAEAKIYTGDIEGGLKSIDNVRSYQGAGLADVAGTGLSLEAAKEELRRERRVSLVFRGISFYDARRWGVIYDISKGGGRKDAVIYTSDGELNTHATINYNFLDYWDVPADEFEINPPAAGSAPIFNPDK